MKEHLTIVLLGDPEVGKDAIGASIQGIAISETYSSTIGYKMFKPQQGIDQQNLKVDIMSIAGDERNKQFVPAYVRDAEVLVFVYDSGNPASFKHLEEWLALANKGTQKDCLKIVVGNKSDLLTHAVTQAEGMEFAEKIGATHFEVSAKTGSNINEFIQSAVTGHLKKAVKAQTSSKVAIENYLVRVSQVEHDWTFARGKFKAKLLDGAVPFLQQEMKKHPNQINSIDSLLNTTIPKDKLGLTPAEMAQFDKYLPKQSDITLREIFAFRSNFMSKGDTRTSTTFDPEVIKSQMSSFLKKEISYLNEKDPRVPLLNKMVNDIAKMNPPTFTSTSELCEHKFKDSKGKEISIVEALNLKQKTPEQIPTFNRFCKALNLSVKDAHAILTQNSSGPRQPDRASPSKT